ncbi:MAG: hypothetical protein ACTSWR_07655 [Candidatus Helarchaeota archaeon]
MNRNFKSLENSIEKQKLFKLMRTEYIKQYIKEANFFYRSCNFDEETIYKALNLLSRFLYTIHPEWPQEKTGFFAAAVYIVSHTPTKDCLYRYESKKDFIKRFKGVSLNSLNWYINRIQNALMIYRIHDKNSRPFWLDTESLEGAIINRIIKRELTKLKSINYYPYKPLIEELVQIIMEKLELIPKQFRKDLFKYIFKKIETNPELYSS